jgi:uncharacterized protein with FMN-binding domain
MKRALLIAGGTIGGLGAVLTITPPQLSSTTQIAGGIPQVDPSVTAKPSSTATPQPSETTTATKKPTTKPTSKPTSSSQPTASAQPTTAPTTAQPQPDPSGTFTGAVTNTRYGPVQVRITVQNGKITDARAVQAPSGSNDRYTQMAVPRLREQTITAQSANIQGVSGASFTSYGWYTSLVSAIAKAGL